MTRFYGMEVKPHSAVTELKRTRIDRVRVEVRRTLLGETEYDVVGALGRDGEGWPLCRPYGDFESAWARKLDIDAAIESARREAE